MTLCPIALGIGCKKCPIFTICLVKGIVGDFKKGKERPTRKRTGSPRRSRQPRDV